MNRLLSIAILALMLAPFTAVGAEPAPSHGQGVAGAKTMPHPAAAKTPQPEAQGFATITGRVEQTMDSGGYTYVLLKKKDGKTVWVAAPQMKAAVGEHLTFEGGMEMVNFKSTTLKRTFDKIIFSNGLAGGQKGGKDAKKEDNRSPGSQGAAVAVTAEKIKVKKATGPNAYTVAEIFKKKHKLNKKKVTVNGKVVKVSAGIMSRNWVHIQDGTGSHQSANNDLVVTSDTIPTVGDLVTVKGTLTADKDFGAGYKYSVIIEKGNITIHK